MRARTGRPAGAAVEFEGGLRQVERHVFDAVVVMLAYPGALYQGPEAFDAVGVRQLLDVGQ